MNDEIYKSWIYLLEKITNDDQEHNPNDDLTHVLLAASLVDRLLEQILSKRFIKGNTSKRLLDPDKGFLGSYRAKADLAYSLALISKNMYNPLITLGEIRNKFAHSHLQITFEDKEIQKLVSTLHQEVTDKMLTKEFVTEIKLKHKSLLDLDSPRTKFFLLMIGLILFLGLTEECVIKSEWKGIIKR